MRPGWLEILVIVLLFLILFGHSKIPNMMKNLANGITTFKKEMKKDDDKNFLRLDLYLIHVFRVLLVLQLSLWPMDAPTCVPIQFHRQI